MILLKGGIHRRWQDRFRNAGALEAARDDRALQRQHGEEARALGRGANTYRPMADSGTPVFTDEHRNPALAKGQRKHGVSDVTLDGMIADLFRRGFRVADIEMFKTAAQSGGPMQTLKVGLHLAEDDECALGRSLAADDLIIEFFERAAWRFCHVWVNPPKPDGQILHTVNVVHREPNEGTAAHRLIFADGFWGLVPAGE